MKKLFIEPEISIEKIEYDVITASGDSGMTDKGHNPEGGYGKPESGSMLDLDDPSSYTL